MATYSCQTEYCLYKETILSGVVAVPGDEFREKGPLNIDERGGKNAKFWLSSGQFVNERRPSLRWPVVVLPRDGAT